jgi:glutamine amidotransferase
MSFIALIDYGMGNLLSVSKALETVGGNIRLVDRPSDAEGASGIVLPGVGNFGDGMEHLNGSGFVPFIRETAGRGTPLLGICLGMQMLLDSSEEAPGVRGLSLIPGRVLRFPERGEKIPQIGWNSITYDRSNPFLRGLPEEPFFYFVHSYYALPDDPAAVAARCTYMIEFAAALSKGKIFAAQFHPEKSQDCGLAILRNFVTICGKDGSEC